MRAAQITNGTFEPSDVPEPPPLLPDQLSIQVHCCGICGSDISLWKDAANFVDVSHRGGFEMSAFDPDRPVVPGHEFAGIVLAAGENVTDFSSGDRVAGIGVATENHTGRPTIIGYSNTYSGGFGQRIIVDAAWVRHVPDSLSLETASLAEPLHVGEMHLQQSDYHDGDTALVIGSGTVGAGVIIALRARGCASIIVVEPSPRRRELATQLGAHHVTAPGPGGPVSVIPDGNRARVVAFECSGRQGMIDELIRTLPYGSYIQMVASPFQPETLTPVIGQWRGIVLNFGGGAFDDPYGVTLQRLADGEIDPSLFITGNVGLDGVEQAFKSLQNPEEHIKILVHPNE